MAKNSGFFDKTGTNKNGIPYIRDAVLIWRNYFYKSIL